jgi:hypothetical protein
VAEVVDTGRVLDMRQRALWDDWGTGQGMVLPRSEAVEERRRSIDHVRSLEKR